MPFLALLDSGTLPVLRFAQSGPVEDSQGVRSRPHQDPRPGRAPRVFAAASRSILLDGRVRRLRASHCRDLLAPMRHVRSLGTLSSSQLLRVEWSIGQHHRNHTVLR